MMRATVMMLLAVAVAAPAAGDDIEDLDKAFVKAMKEGDIAAIVPLYEEDAVLYPPDRDEVRGAKAIGQYFSDFFSQFVVKEFTLRDNAYDKEDDLAVSWGRYTIVVAPKTGGAEEKANGRFTGIARRKDGKWRYIADHGSLPFSPPAPSRPPLK